MKMSAPKIVICDDEAGLLVELAEWFTLQGWDVHAASSARDALLALNRCGHAACLVTDKRMPVSDGDVLLQVIKNLPADERPDLVAIMTGDSGMDGATHSHPGADLVFFKPVDPIEMLAAIASRLKSIRQAPLSEQAPSALAGAKGTL